MRDVDFVIVGQGLAGTALAWQLRWRGCRVLVLDREPAVTSSRIAAGLVTPVTGLRMAPTWRFAELLPAAREHYRRVERETGLACFRPRRCLRIFQSPEERALFVRKAPTALAGLVAEPDPPIDPAWFEAPLGGFEMPDAGQLLTGPYLDGSRAVFTPDGGYRTDSFDPVRDVVPEGDGVRLPRLGLLARAVVFCQGHAGSSNPWFLAIRFHSARGDILTLRIPGLGESRIVNRGVWLTPGDDGTHRAGATYDRTNLLDEPSPNGREAIVTRLREFLRLPFEVLDHRAAVRPIIDPIRPVLGFHPLHPGLGFFNGLGSKGALVAPFFAARLADTLVHGHPLESEVDLRRLTTRT